MTLRNLRAYTQDADDTLTSVTASDYGTGNGANARLRKINLNVDIATQAELNEAFNLLSNAIQDISTGTLSNYYTKPEVNDISTALSTALTGEIDAEATARKEADNAITASLSAYALSTTVADAYKVSVSDAADQTSSFVYTIKQGELTAGTINVPKDMFVEGASFQGTVLVLSVRGQDTPISTDLSGLVDEYTGSEDSEVKVTTDGNVISVVLKDTIARVGTAEDLSTANTIYGAKAYADEVAAAVAVTAEGETGEGALVTASDENNVITVGSTEKLKDAVAAAETAIQDVVGDGIYLTADFSQEEHKVTVSAADRLTDVVSAVETSVDIWNAAETNAKAYTDIVSAALSTAFNTEIGAEKTRAEGVEQALSGAIDNLSSSLSAAQGDDYISAYVDGNTVKVEALCATVWNEVSAKIDTSKVVTAANELSVLALSALSDYNDIDEIISEVEKIKGALVNFTRALEA